jgi:hypothetical protein
MGASWGVGIGKERTKLGHWLARKGITHEEISKWSGITRVTISRMSSDSSYRASALTKRSIVSALVSKGYEVEEYDLW